MKFTKKSIIYKTCLSRFFYLSISTISHTVLPHFDKSAGHNLYKWDSIYFKNIIYEGYTSEHHLAFFPLLPLICKFFKIFYIHELIICNLFVIVNALLLYDLVMQLFNFEIANISLFFFLYNPCSIIMSMFYTESLFMLLFLLFINRIINKEYTHASILLSLSCLCRSNGILFITFLQFSNLRIIFDLCISLSLLVIYQLYALSRIFKITQQLRLFIPYFFIQTKYWNQGFLKFYTTNNIPNMFIGFPFVILCLVIFYYNTKIQNYNLNSKKLSIFNNLNRLLLVQTLISIFFIQLNMFYRFVGYNPVIYIGLGCIYKDMNDCIVFRVVCKYFFAFSVAYAVLYGAFYPPA